MGTLLCQLTTVVALLNSGVIEPVSPLQTMRMWPATAGHITITVECNPDTVSPLFA